MDWDYFTEEQISILEWKIEGKSHRSVQECWRAKYQTTLSLDAISVCIARAARGLEWNHQLETGADSYLCPADLLALEDIISSKSYSGQSLEAHEVLEEAVQLKKFRISQMSKFLSSINMEQMSAKYPRSENFHPSRSWLNSIVENCTFSCKIVPSLMRIAFCAAMLMLFGSFSQ